jgi:putative SOS response-associated peptidase YedK
MCGRYVNKNSFEDIEKLFQADLIQSPSISIQPSYNICPTQYSPVVVSADEKYQMKNMHWGLIPSWSKDSKFATNLINARIETVQEKPSFKGLTNTSRCIVIASGYYEWVQTDSGKQPYYIHGEHNVLPIAGLWTRWKDIKSFTIITKSANSNISNIHHRMPLIIEQNHIKSFLDHSIKFDSLYNNQDIRLRYHKVSKLVNKPVKNDMSCITSIE